MSFSRPRAGLKRGAFEDLSELQSSIKKARSRSSQGTLEIQTGLSHILEATHIQKLASDKIYREKQKVEEVKASIALREDE